MIALPHVVWVTRSALRRPLACASALARCTRAVGAVRCMTASAAGKAPRTPCTDGSSGSGSGGSTCRHTMERPPVMGRGEAAHSEEEIDMEAWQGSDVALVGAAADAARAGIAFEWDNGLTTIFHNVWLRDNCQCPACFDAVTLQRTFDTATMDLDAMARSVKVSDGHVDVIWDSPAGSGHHSSFSADWLRDRAYCFHRTSDPTATELPINDTPVRRAFVWEAGHFDTTRYGTPTDVALVDAAAAAREPRAQPLAQWQGVPMPAVEYEEVMHTDRGVLEWLNMVRVFGFGFVTGVPRTLEATEAVSRRAAFVRDTLYGGMWETKIIEDGEDSAYQAVELPVHTDGNYLQDPPGIQIFHCLQQAGVGGASTLVDGFRVAEYLEEHHSDTFKYLSESPVLFQTITPTTQLQAEHQVFTLDDLGQVLSVRFNALDRAPRMSVPPSEVPLFYRHWQTMTKVAEMKEHTLEFDLTPGHLIAIDNWRVFHGRRSFDETSGRCLAGCYLNYEDVKGRHMNLLRKHQGGGSTGDDGASKRVELVDDHVWHL